MHKGLVLSSLKSAGARTRVTQETPRELPLWYITNFIFLFSGTKG
jgi:hypothetical protein